MSSETCLEAAEFVAEAPGNVRHARSMMQAATIVTFDVDATVLACEGLDELAAFIGKADEVAVLTQQCVPLTCACLTARPLRSCKLVHEAPPYPHLMASQSHGWGDAL